MIKYILGTIFIALACVLFTSANVPPAGGSLEDLIHEIFTPPPDLSSKGNTNPHNQPGVIGQPGPVQPGPVPQQPPIQVNVSVSL